MEESNSNSSKDLGDHVMTDPSEAGTPRGDVTILGPSSQPGTPCSDLMVPTAAHTPLPPSHTPVPQGHAPGVPLGHLTHGGVLTSAHSDLSSVHTLGLSVPASLPPSTSMVNLTPTQISLGYSLSSPIGSLSSSISGQLSANTISSFSAPLDGLHGAHTLPPVSGLMQRVVTQGSFADLSPLPPGQGMVLPAVNTIGNMTYGSTYSVDSSTPAPYHYGGGHSQMTLGSNYRQELEAVLARMQEKDMQQEKQRQRREAEDHHGNHMVVHHSKHLEQHHAMPTEAEDLSALDQGMHHQHVEYATYLPKSNSSGGPPLEANDGRMGHMMQERTTNHTPDHLHMSHPASPMPAQTANHRLGLSGGSALPSHMSAHHRMTESPIAQAMDSSLQTLPSHMRHESHMHQMALLNPDDRLRMELANVHRDAQAYIKPAHGLMQNQEDTLEEDVNTDLDQQQDQNLEGDGRGMELQEAWQDRRSVQSHWMHYFPWLIISDDKYFCRICLAAGMEIVFAKGRELYDEEHMDKEVFVKHEQSSLHRDAEHRLGLVEHSQLPPPILQIPLPLGNNPADLVMKDHTMEMQSQQPPQPQQPQQQQPQASQQEQVVIEVTPAPLQTPVVSTASVRETSETILPPRKRANELSAQAISNPAEETPTQIDSTNCSAIRNLPPEKRGIGNRSIHERWFLDFPWLVYHVTNNEFYCHICREGKADTQYASGVPAKCPKKSNFMNHEKTAPHREAANRLGLPSAIKKGAYTAVPSNTEDVEEECSAVASRRKIRADWFVDFPWLEINRYHMLFTCFLCKKYKQPGVFTTGKSIANPKKDNFSKHEETEGHKLAVLMASGLSLEEAKNSLVAGTDLQLETSINSEQDDDLEDRNGECGELTGIFPGPVSESDNAVIDMVYNNLRGSGSNKLLNFFQMKQGPQNRRVQLEWFLDYPWLELHKERKVFLCKYCRIYHPYGAFVSGKPLNNPKKTDLDKHQDTDGHKFALRTYNADPTNSTRDDLKAESIGAIDGTTVAYLSDDFGTVMVLAKQSLFLQHPWLQHDPQENSYFCALCRDLLDHPALVANVRKDDLVQHEQTESHHQAIIIQLQNKHSKQTGDGAVDSGSQEMQQDSMDQSLHGRDSENKTLTSTVEDPKILPWQEAFWHYASQLQKLGILCDITLVVHERGPRGGSYNTEFKAHKVLLVCASGYFKECLKDAMLDNKYIFDNISARGLGGILSYIYGRLSEVPPDAFEDCSNAADILLMPLAKEYFADKHKSYYSGETEQCKEVPPEIPVEKTQSKSDNKRNRKSKAKRKSTPTKRSVDAMESVQTSSIPVYIPAEVDSSPHVKKRKHREQQQQEQQRLQQQQQEQQKYEEEQQHLQQEYERRLQQDYEDQQRLQEKQRLQEQEWLEQQQRIHEQQQLEEQQRLQDQQRLQEQQQLEEQQRLQDQQRLEEQQRLQEQQHLEQQEKEYLRQQQLHQQQLHEQQIQEQIRQQQLQQQMMQEQQLQAEQLQQQPDDKPEEEETTVTDLSHLNVVEEMATEEDDYEDYRPKKIAKVATTQPRVTRLSNKAAEKKPKSKWKTEEAEKEDKKAGPVAKEIPEREIPSYEYASERKRQLSKYLPACDICGKKFLRKGCIERHKQKFHANNQMKPSFQCPDCDKLCPSRHDLKLHRRVHTGERPYSCPDCPKKFTRKETLIEHQYIHRPDNEKPHRCPVCSKGFFKIYDLQRHFTGIHSGKKPFMCDLCGKSFPWARSLADHVAAHKGPERNRPYKCPDCRMTFVRKYDLKRHSVTHTQEKPFICDWCGHGFTQKGSRDKHKREFCRGKPENGGEENKQESEESAATEEMVIQEEEPQGQSQDQGQTIPAAVPQQNNGEFDNLIETSSSQYFPTALIFYTE